MWHLARTVTGGLVTVSAVAQVDRAVARAADGMSPPADRTRLIHLRLAVLSYTYITRLSGSSIIVTIQRNTTAAIKKENRAEHSSLIDTFKTR